MDHARPRVIIVPGLPGSQLGRASTDEPIWFDLGSIRAGHFLDLAAGGPPLDVLGVFEELYLRMVAHLQLAGYDVGYYPYDWRRPLERDAVKRLGRRLATARLFGDPAEPVALIPISDERYKNAKSPRTDLDQHVVSRWK